MTATADRLYGLLPAIHRVRDAAVAQQAGLATGPLYQLLAVMGEQVAAIEEDLDQLYDDQFIETCADWVVPYLADLVGYAPIRSGGASLVSRSEVANTIRYRRAKGTAVALEGVARDVTGRDVAVVEYYRRVATTQHLNHIRPAVGTVSLRDPVPLQDPGGPFDTVAHGAELRAMAQNGRWNLLNVACFLWPWRSLQLLDAAPGVLDPLRYAVSPLGADLGLVNVPVPVTGQLAGPGAVATRLRVRGGADMAARIARSVGITVGGVAQAFEVCDLSDIGPDPLTSGWAHMPASGIALDPERGRLAFAQPPAAAVRVSYAYGSPGLLGGGPYAREAGFDVSLAPLVHVPAQAADLATALGAQPASGAIEIAGNGRYAAPASIAVAGNQKLEIRAADGCRPVLDLQQPLVLSGGDSAELVLNGFLIIGGGLDIPASVGGQPNGLQQVTLRHCTLVPGLARTRAGAPASPGAPSVTLGAAATLVLENCVCGPLWAALAGTLRVSDSVLDAGDAAAPAIAGIDGHGSGPASWIYNSTVRGGVAAETLPLASNVIFVGPVLVDRLQSGLVRFSFVSPGSHTPRRYSCVSPPDGARWPEPLFRSLQLLSPDYARLSGSAPAALRTGADDGGQMGAWHGALDTPAEDGLAVRMAEYTRFGLASGMFRVQNA